MKILYSVLFLSNLFRFQNEKSEQPSFAVQIMSAPPGAEEKVQKCNNNSEFGYCPKEGFLCCQSSKSYWCCDSAKICGDNFNCL